MVHHFPSLSVSYEVHHYHHMFTEDICLGIMPIGGRSEERKNFDIRLVGETVEQDRATNCCASLAHYGHQHQPSALVSDAVETVASSLGYNGVCHYEILNDRNDPACPYLHYFTPKKLIRLPGWYFQFTPRKDYRWVKKRFSAIRSSAVWRIALPSALGGTRAHRRLLWMLKKTNPLCPAFAKENINLIQSTPGYDVIAYARSTKLLVNKLTKRWGWNRRDLVSENATEFYGIFKYVSFEWAKALLREHIIQEINSLLRDLGINCFINVVGLPGSQDILKARQGLLDGSVSFDQVFDLVSAH